MKNLLLIRSHWRQFALFALAITGCGWFTYQCVLSILPIWGMVGNACPAWLPVTIEDWGRFRLPPSARKLESFCMGMQGWIATAKFEMQPRDLESFMANTHIRLPLSTEMNPENPWRDDDAVQALRSYLYGEAENGWQTVLIDTSRSDWYVVYFQAVGGH